MPNSIPYLALIVINIPLIVWTIWMKKELGLISVFFTYVGMIFCIEFFVLVAFDGYQYYPKLISIPYYDNVMGALISDLVTVPTGALIIAAFQLKLRWIVLMSVIYGGIELLFIHLRIYLLNWWEVPYTVILFLSFFLFAKLWLKVNQQRYRASIHFVSLFFISYTLIATGIFIASVLNLHLVGSGIFKDVYRDNVFTEAIRIAVEATVLACIQYFFPRNFWWQLSYVCFSLVFYYTLMKAHLIHLYTGVLLFFSVAALRCLAILILDFLLNRWLLKLFAARS